MNDKPDNIVSMPASKERDARLRTASRKNNQRPRSCWHHWELDETARTKEHPKL